MHLREEIALLAECSKLKVWTTNYAWERGEGFPEEVTCEQKGSLCLQVELCFWQGEQRSKDLTAQHTLQEPQVSQQGWRTEVGSGELWGSQINNIDFIL